MSELFTPLWLATVDLAQWIAIFTLVYGSKKQFEAYKALQKKVAQLTCDKMEAEHDRMLKEIVK